MDAVQNVCKAAGVCAYLLTLPQQTGLPIDEAASGYAKRQAKYGVNVHEKPPQKSWL